MEWRGRPGGVLLGLALLLAAGFARPVFADVTHSVTVSASVPGESPPVPNNPIVQFSGIAAASASVEIRRDGTLITTISAGSDATFSTILTGQPVGEHMYVVSAKDSSGMSLTSLTFALDLQLGTTTLISGVFLGPSIEIDKPTYKFGENATLTGRTAPSSAVTVSVSSTSTKTFTVQSDSKGQWTRTVNTKDLGAGRHTAKARAVKNSVVSAYSPEVVFTVSPFDPGEGKAKSDINTDGQVNLIDFSVMMYYWHQRNPANSRADVNKDGIVDITDFSIMLFQWTA